MSGRPSAILVLLALTFPGSTSCAAAPGAPGGGPAGSLPGAEPHPPALAARLGAALAALGPGYAARTRHRRADGSPLYTNRLLLETSPYLRQHAHNPVDWFPWGDEAFETARRLGRPVLLSVGYSTCHWCHVMEEESFEDEEIAAYLNANYVAIKVDREERPDVDGIYMTAVQMLTGRGGWPMTVWLTPDRKPFHGGTYFPARDGDRGAGRGFLTLLREMKAAYDESPEDVALRARQVADRIEGALAPDPGGAAPGSDPVEVAIRSLRATFDAAHGGRQGAPKFPSNLPLRLLLWRHRRSGESDLLDMATLTLRKMAAGGIYDQIGGGFHRYATDERWLVPHFEKMLYDNALLAIAYLEAHQATGQAEFARIAREILRYVAREMTSPEGAFYSATDADSLDPAGESEEGRFFTWTPAEVRAALGEEAGLRIETCFGITEEGNFEGRSIPYLPRPLAETARLLATPTERLAADVEAARERLYAARSRRPAPLRDDKVLAAWNGLMISALARGGFVLDDRESLERARRAAAFLLERMRVDGRLRRSFKDGAARHPAFLEDYAFTIAGLIDLHEVTGEPRWLEEAIALQATLDEHYADDAVGGYFMTADDHERLLAREKPAYDGAEPSGNSVALMNLLRLGELTGGAAYRRGAERLQQAFSGVLARRPIAVAELLLGLEFGGGTAREVVLVMPEGGSSAEPMLEVLRRTFVPDKVVVLVAPQDYARQAAVVPLVLGKVARDGLATAYVCEQGTCKLPTTDPAVFRAQLAGAGAEPSRPEKTRAKRHSAD